MAQRHFGECQACLGYGPCARTTSQKDLHTRPIGGTEDNYRHVRMQNKCEIQHCDLVLSSIFLLIIRHCTKIKKFQVSPPTHRILQKWWRRICFEHYKNRYESIFSLTSKCCKIFGLDHLVWMLSSTASVSKFLEDWIASWCCFPHRQCPTNSSTHSSPENIIILSVSSDDFLHVRLQVAEQKMWNYIIPHLLYRIRTCLTCKKSADETKSKIIFPRRNKFIMTTWSGLSFLLIALYTLWMWILLYIPGRNKWYNNSHTSSTRIDLYDIPHIFYTRMIHTHCLRTLTGYY